MGARAPIPIRLPRNPECVVPRTTARCRSARFREALARRRPLAPLPLIGDAALAGGEGRRWTKVLAHYAAPDPRRSVLELLATSVPFLSLWALMLFCLERYGPWACLPLALPTSGFLVRLFMVQHDCGHGSFFRRRALNDWTGRVLGVLTLAPYDYWRRTHAVHHATTGNLDRRG